MVQTIKARRALQSVKAPPTGDDSARSSSLVRGDLPPSISPHATAAISTQSRMHRSWGRAMFEDHAPLVVGPAPKDDADSPLILLWLAWTTLSPYQRLGVALVVFAGMLAIGTVIAWAGTMLR